MCEMNSKGAQLICGYLFVRRCQILAFLSNYHLHILVSFILNSNTPTWVQVIQTSESVNSIFARHSQNWISIILLFNALSALDSSLPAVNINPLADIRMNQNDPSASTFDWSSPMALALIMDRDIRQRQDSELSSVPMTLFPGVLWLTTRWTLLPERINVPSCWQP